MNASEFSTSQGQYVEETKLALFCLVYLPNLTKISSMFNICLKKLIQEIMEKTPNFRGFDFYTKYSFICVTCNNKKICHSCSKNCHKDHDVVSNGITMFRCECNTEDCEKLSLPDKILTKPIVISMKKASYSFL